MKTWEDIKPGTYHLRNSLGVDLYRTVISVTKRKVTYTRAEVAGISEASPETFLRVWKMYGVGELVET